MNALSYDVVVGNIGTVCQGAGREEALAAYDRYVGLSLMDHGYASGESVTLLCDGDVVQEHMGTVAE